MNIETKYKPKMVKRYTEITNVESVNSSYYAIVTRTIINIETKIKPKMVRYTETTSNRKCL